MEFFINKLLKSKNLTLIFIYLIYFAILFPFLSFVPIWDGRQYAECLVKAVGGGFHPMRFNCCGHPSAAYIFFIGIGQYFSPGNPYLLNLANLLLGTVAICFFYKLLSRIFSQKYQAEVLLLTAIWAVFPVFTANTLNINPDYGLVCFFLPFLFFLLKNQKIPAVLTGLLMVFSKEVGLILYAISLSLYFIIITGKNKWSPVNLKLWFRTSSFKKRFLKREYVIFLVPIIMMALYFLLKQFYSHEGALWGGRQTIRSLFSFRFPKVYLSYLIGIFVLNFNWIPSMTIGFFLINKYIFNKHHGKVQVAGNSFRFISWLFVTALIIITSFKTYLNVRYFSPLYPLLFMIFLYCLISSISKKMLRIIILITVFVLFLVSDFRTVDPVSKRIFGVFKFGKHEILKVSDFSKEYIGYGRDSLVYNLEYVYFHYLQNRFYQDVKPTENTWIIRHYFSDWYLNGPLDKNTYDRTLRTDNIFYPHYAKTDDIKDGKNRPEHLYYIEFPNFDNQKELSLLKEYYNIKKLKHYEADGYGLAVYYLELKG